MEIENSDSNVLHKKVIITLPDSCGVIHYTNDKAAFKHTLGWLFEGFEPKYPLRHNNGVASSFKLFFKHIKKHPLLSLAYWLWFVKACYAKFFKLTFYAGRVL
jgi:hypothetical protein